MSPSLIILCLTIPVKLMRFNYILKEICNTYLRKHWPFLSSPDCKVYGKWKSAAGLLADCHKLQRGCSEMCEIYAHHPRTEIKQEKKKRMKNDFQREKQPGAKKNSIRLQTGNSLQVKIYRNEPSLASLPSDIFTFVGHLSFIR